MSNFLTINYQNGIKINLDIDNLNLAKNYLRFVFIDELNQIETIVDQLGHLRFKKIDAVKNHKFLVNIPEATLKEGVYSINLEVVTRETNMIIHTFEELERFQIDIKSGVVHRKKTFGRWKLID